MLRTQLQTTFLMLGCLAFLCGSSQSIDPLQAKGQVKIQKNSAGFNISGISNAMADELRSGLEKIKDIALRDSILKYPVGFNVIVDFVAHEPTQEVPWQKQKTSSVLIDLYDLYLDNESNSIKPSSEYSASINIRVNSFGDLYPNTYSNDIAAVNFIVPVFFLKYLIKQTDSTKNYIEIEMQVDHPVRAITNGKSPFAPLTKGQFLQYKIATDKYALAQANDNYSKDQETLNETKQHLTTARKAQVKTDLLKMQMTTDSALINNYSQLKLLETEKNLADTWSQRLTNHSRQLASLSETDKSAPAYMVWKVRQGDAEADSLEELTTESDSAAEQLWTLNPKYFDKTSSMADIQLITVAVSFHPQMTSAFIKEKLMDIFKSLDYEKLKAAIRW